MSATATRKRPARSIRRLAPGLVQITVGKNATTYHVEELPTDTSEGQHGYRLTKEDGESYDVLVDTREGHHTCECMGFLAHNHCKHVEGLAALLKSTTIPKERQTDERYSRLECDLLGLPWGSKRYAPRHAG